MEDDSEEGGWVPVRREEVEPEWRRRERERRRGRGICERMRRANQVCFGILRRERGG